MELVWNFYGIALEQYASAPLTAHLHDTSKWLSIRTPRRRRGGGNSSPGRGIVGSARRRSTKLASTLVRMNHDLIIDVRSRKRRQLPVNCAEKERRAGVLLPQTGPATMLAERSLFPPVLKSEERVLQHPNNSLILGTVRGLLAQQNALQR